MGHTGREPNSFYTGHLFDRCVFFCHEFLGAGSIPLFGVFFLGNKGLVPSEVEYRWKVGRRSLRSQVEDITVNYPWFYKLNKDISRAVWRVTCRPGLRSRTSDKILQGTPLTGKSPI